MPDSGQLCLYREIFEGQIRRLQSGRFTLHLPRPPEKIRWLAGTHFHFHPELFIQAGGLTDFRFPQEKIRLLQGEALLVPRWLPHEETCRKFKSDFLNLVVMFPGDGVSIHAAAIKERQEPTSINAEYFKTDRGSRIEQYLDDIIGLYHSGEDKKREPEVEKAVRGLFMATLASLLLVIKQIKTLSRTTEHPKVSECRKFILGHLYEPSLSVRTLAGQIRCSADYLSHLFVTETGGRLIDYIHEERIALAKRHLRNPALNIKEVAWACGLADPGYFTRLFKRLSGKTPKTFRKESAGTI